jgi:peptidyl-prolyl cis-trans isomerase SurA
MAMYLSRILLFPVFYTLIFPHFASAQKDEDVLFTVNNNPVTVGEFKYIYTKTNGANAVFTKTSLQEYLDLYIKFKLKVEEAKTLQIGNLPDIKEELLGYRRQLSDAYILNKEVTGKLVRELYDRSQEDIDISHILYTISDSTPKDDSLSANRFLMDLYAKLKNGADFEEFARNYSLDRSSKTNSGHIGFINVPFPNGFYDLETAAYTMSPGDISLPIYSPAGLHLLKVNARRPARGEIEGAHILIRKSGEGENPFTPKNKIDSLYGLLQSGSSFEKLAATYSEDDKTANKGGYIGVFGINKYEQAFEDAIFNLEKDGQYSQPIQTNLGWHIVKRISRKPIANFETSKANLEAAVRQDQRYAFAKENMFHQIRVNAGFVENKQTLSQMIPFVNDTFYTFRWKIPNHLPAETLFTLADKSYTLIDFAQYLEKSSRLRFRQSQQEPIPSMLTKLYEGYLEEETLKLEEGQLEKKYPEFKHLLREYEEGILLFEVTRQIVWDKAAQDSAGLADFYTLVQGKYTWNERAVTTRYTLKASAKDQIAQIRDFAKTHKKNEVLVRFNKDENEILSAEELTIEKGKSPEANQLGLQWKQGQVTNSTINNASNDMEFYKIEKILPVGPKALEESKGYIIADYQDFLEKEWVDNLRKKYSVQITKNIFEGLIKP